MENESLRQYITEYLDEFSQEKGLLPSTIENKRVSMRKFLEFVGSRNVTVPLIREYLSILRQRLMESSIRCEVKNLRAFGNFLVKRRYIQPSDNWADQLVMPRKHKIPITVPDMMTMEQVIIAGTESQPYENERCRKAKSETREALCFALRTGLRSIELRTLEPKRFSLDREDPTFSVIGKGGKTRFLPVPPDMLAEVKERCLQARKFLFNVSEKGLNVALKRGAEKMGIVGKVHCHTCRHCFATELLRTGTPIEKVSQLLGHENIQLTYDTYSHLLPNDFLEHLARLPVIQASLPINRVFESAIAAIQRSGITKDARFTHEIRKGDHWLEISIQVV